MKILAKLNRINLKQNRTRTIVTIIGVALSIALILSVIGVATSFLNSWRLREIEEYGDYHQRRILQQLEIQIKKSRHAFRFCH